MLKIILDWPIRIIKVILLIGFSPVVFIVGIPLVWIIHEDEKLFDLYEEHYNLLILDILKILKI